MWSNRGSALRKRGLFTDITVRIGDSAFQCHKIVLATASEYFEILLQKDGLDTGEVKLQEIHPKVFEIFLDFIYTKDKGPLLQINAASLLSLFKCANMWLAREVQQVCESILAGRSMEPKELIQLYALSFLLDNKSLKAHALKLLRSGNNMDCPEVVELEIDCFVEYFFGTNGLEQWKRFNMLDKWLEKHIPQERRDQWKRCNMIDKCLQAPNPQERRLVVTLNRNVVQKPNPKAAATELDKITALLASIDFMRMSLDDFYKGPAKSNLLSESAKIEFMYKLAKSNNGIYNYGY
ncbi:kelch-like protein 21 [Drosophila biarmipes]|uniref:kelch-like protein 21 n=1 Tax=Drosophila biarmipes TaxID=125945 RepID=UPI0007E6F2E8|nr:kelch-like protein 21 [Drosophila biarmipes]